MCTGWISRPNLVCQVVLVLLTISTVGQIAVLYHFTWLWNEARWEGLRHRQREVCVTMATDESCEGFVDDTGDVPKCCNKTSAIVDQVLVKHSRTKFDEYTFSRLLSRDFCMTRIDFPAASLRGIDIKQSRKHDHLVWDIHTPLTVLRNVGQRKGRLLIEQPGYYFVFVQVKLRTVSYKLRTLQITSADQDVFSTDNVGHPSTINLQLYRYSNKHDKTRLLMERTETECDVISDVYDVTMSMGAAFLLHQGDELFAVTTRPDIIAPSYIGNLFELYLI